MSHTPPGRTRERIFRYVRGRLLAGRPPTVREVQEAFGFRAPASAREQLESLVAEGRLAKDVGRSRGYRLPGSRGGNQTGGNPAIGDLLAVGSGTVLVPVLGRVQAGALTEAIEEAVSMEDTEFVCVAEGRRRGELFAQQLFAQQLFALTVRGESMRDAGILDGDVVVVRRQRTAETGRIVVALVVDGESGVPEATVKTLRLVPRRSSSGEKPFREKPFRETPFREKPFRETSSGDMKCDDMKGDDASRLRVELHPANPDFAPIVPPPGTVEILGVVIEVRRDLDRRSSHGAGRR